MNRLLTSMTLALLAIAASGACLAAGPAAAPAEDPAFCKSMCASEQNVCRAQAGRQLNDERLAKGDEPDRNPFARTAQEQVARPDLRALDAAGDQNRKAQRFGTCDSSYQRCTRSCSASAPARALTPALTPASANTPGGK